MPTSYLLTSTKTPPLSVLKVVASAHLTSNQLINGNDLTSLLGVAPQTPQPVLVSGGEVIVGVSSIAYFLHTLSVAPKGDGKVLKMLQISESGDPADTVSLAASLDAFSGSKTATTVADICLALTIQNSCQSTSTPASTKFVTGIITSPTYKQAAADLPKFTASGKSSGDGDGGFLPLITGIFAKAVLSAFPQSSAWESKQNAVVKCPNTKFGDFQCNSAMELFQRLKAAGAKGVVKPHDVSKKIIDGIDDAGKEVLSDFSVAGPGFINCRVRKDFLVSRLYQIVTTGDPNPAKNNRKRKKSKVVVDFSSPNIAKEMHVGHLRSTIIGETTCRILEYNGDEVVRQNHVGDWGTQFGMLIQYLKEEFPNFTTDQPNITDLTTFYKNAKARFDEDEDFKKVSQQNVVKLQGGDEECRGIWQILCDISRKEFEKVYKRLDVDVKECGESFYNSRIPPVIKALEKIGLVVRDGGAKCIFVPGSAAFTIPLMVQKSDGGYGYDSTDMAALDYRINELKANRLVYVTDFTQGTHFQLCFEAAKMAGWWNETNTSLEHIGFGTVQGEDGKRFKTRSGETVRLVDLLDEAVNRMEAKLKERAKEGKLSVPEGEIRDVASAIGYGAVKYFDLSRNPATNYKFSYDAMLDTNGNTAVYLLFAHARINSIIAKAKAEHNVDISQVKGDKSVNITLEQSAERILCFEILQFPDMIEKITKNLRADHICNYLYGLSIVFTTFVTECRVLGSEEMKSRLLLCECTRITMRACFKLLAIDYPERI